jgi:hypothetical protein
MAIKIISCEEPVVVKNLIMTLYSLPGIGKTTLGATTDKPLLLDFDGGMLRAGKRPYKRVTITQWSDVASLEESDLADCNTVVIDTVGRCLEILSDYLIKSNPKLGRADGSLTLQGYGSLNVAFKAFLTKLRGYDKDIIMLAHAKEDKDGDIVTFRIDAIGSSKNEITKLSDLIGYIYTINNQRTISFNPTDSFIGKNCAEIPTSEIPKPIDAPLFLASLIEDAKTTLNAESVVQIKAQKKEAVNNDIAMEMIGKIKSTADCNLLIGHDLIQSKHLKMALMKKAESLSFVFNKETKMFCVANENA